MDMKIRYKVVKGTGIEGILFGDMIYIDGGVKKNVRHKIGEVLKDELIPENMLKLSLEKGFLRRFLDAGVVMMVDAETGQSIGATPVQAPVNQTPAAKVVKAGDDPGGLQGFLNSKRSVATPIMRGDGISLYGEPQAENRAETVEPGKGAGEADVVPAPPKPEAKVEVVPPAVPPVAPPADFSQVTEDNISSMPFLEQLKFVKQCDDSKLLDKIRDKVTSKQLKYNITRRQNQLKSSK